MSAAPEAAMLERALADTGEEVLELTRRLVAVDSSIPPHADERAVVALVRAELVARGLPAGEILAREPDRPNLVVRIPGASPGPRLLLNGHLDTKPVGAAAGEWRTDPWRAEVVDGRLYGLGASDMKGAVAAMIVAVSALRRAGLPLAGEVVLGLVADEEAGAQYGSAWLAGRLRAAADACLIGEPSGWERDWQGLHTISRGLCCFDVVVRGTQRHSSLSDRMPARNAILQAAGLARDLHARAGELFPPDPGRGLAPTLNVAVTMSGGVFYGVTPGEARFGCDLRTVPGLSFAEVDARLRGWLAERAAEQELDAELVYADGLRWIDAAEIPAGHPLVAAAQRAGATVLGQAPPLSMFPGTTDAPWYANLGIPTIPSFGPGILTYCHGPNEFVSVRALREAVGIYAHTILGYCGIAR
ncbi:M20 family metallopeptidase [Dactylosporangium salmoneum]|uniref:M20 family metallopeptidase n=1 Tax=Dactylosporangium salmoneum TaxID=53361 RepID=A0ABP5UUS3_9ACTN